MLVHGGFAGLYIERAPRLNLHKAQDILFPSDQVDLTPATRRPEVARDHCVTQFPQMEVRRFFTPTPYAMMLCNFLRRQRSLRRPVQSPQHQLRRHSGKCPSRMHKEISN
jgi:hypothetical protein